MKEYTIETTITIKETRKVTAPDIHRAIVQAEDTAKRDNEKIHPGAVVSAKSVKKAMS